MLYGLGPNEHHFFYLSQTSPSGLITFRPTTSLFALTIGEDLAILGSTIISILLVRFVSQANYLYPDNNCLGIGRSTYILVSFSCTQELVRTHSLRSDLNGREDPSEDRQALSHTR